MDKGGVKAERGYPKAMRCNKVQKQIKLQINYD